MSSKSIENQYQEYQQEEYEEFLEWRESKLREKGLLSDGTTPLGDSVHPGTIKSYEKLKLPFPDSVRLATLRPNERMKRIMLEMGKPLNLKITNRHIMRLKDKESGKEFLVWDRHEEFNDANGNIRTLDYRACGCHQEVEGKVKRDANYKIVGSEVTGHKTIFDKEFTKKNLEELLKYATGETAFAIGFTKTHGKDAVYSRSDKVYQIANVEDFKTGSFEELWESGSRGLSDNHLTPSLSRLKQPVSEDPPSSLEKRRRGFISPASISYSQTSYR